MEITIKYFGLIAETVAKQEEVLVRSNSTTLEELKADLEQQYPILKEKEYQIAVNQELVKTNISITENTEIALLPAFAGG